jgi:hypothetical protein
MERRMVRMPSKEGILHARKGRNKKIYSGLCVIYDGRQRLRQIGFDEGSTTDNLIH